MLALAVSGGGCAAKKAVPDAGPPPDAGVTFDPASLAKAEDQRRAGDVAAIARTSHDVTVRRAAARALSRIGGPSSVEGLERALEDEDAETVTWGAYGLGADCKGREDVTVKALAARAATFESDPSYAAPPSAARDAVDPRVAIARAVGRCGGASAEAVLASWLRGRDVLASGAAYALGDVAARNGALTEATMSALLEAAATASPVEGALYPFGRLERVPDPFAGRVARAALSGLAQPSGLGKAFAVRALGRSGPTAAGDLARVALDKNFTPAERADAARALRNLGEDGHAAAADALVQAVPSKDAVDPARVAGDDYGVLSSLVGALGGDLSKRQEAPLYALTSAYPPAGTPLPIARRMAELRCGAAAALAKGAYDADVLKRCDAESSEASERARLGSLLRRSLVGERRAAWRAFTKSNHVKIREAALEGIAQHPELGDIARAALVDGLSAKKGGIVATAAAIVHAHPDRVMNPAAASAGRALDPVIATALSEALARPWPQDLVETRAALLDAAAAVSLEGARAAALAACHDHNATMRERAAKALRELDDPNARAAEPNCSPPSDPGPLAPELGHTRAHDVRLRFSTDAGDLAIVFEPALSPIAVTRFVALAKAGFYDGIVVHRVVPGFVAQFGDPDGDGYGGAGTLLRCETSPIPFGPLDVGVALAGRDTGSSQLFVTLGRFPHLDGEFARVGRAEGDWWALAEGDAIRAVKVEE
jgi:cyclophilin family peptidyl-prolyl cis-trans isomerase